MKDITIKAQAGTVTPQGAVRAAILPPKLLDDFLITSSSRVTRLKITSTDIVRESKASPESAGVIIAILAVGFGLATVFLCINYVSDESRWAVTGTACWSRGLPSW